MENQTSNSVLWTRCDPPLSENSLNAINSMGFIEMTPVQAITIPLFLQNKDVVVEAVTGSGKTLAFLIPVLEILNRQLLQQQHEKEDSDTDYEQKKKPKIKALVLSPTRELASQISKVLNELLSFFPFDSLLMTGGRPLTDDLVELSQKSKDIILIATPGKLNAALQQSSLQLKQIEVLIMDEADRLLQMGFHKEVLFILSFLPKQRRSGLFSATMRDGMESLVKAGLRYPVRVQVKVENKEVEEQRIPQTLSIYYSIVKENEKFLALLTLLSKNKDERIIVFMATCHAVSFFSQLLQSLPKSVVLPKIHQLHAKLPHKTRQKIHQQFSEADSGSVLICTDLAARGLDFKNVQTVIHYDAPTDPESFVHRCGRTARQGNIGKSILLIHEQETVYVEFMGLRKIPMSQLELKLLNSEEIIPTKQYQMPSYYKNHLDSYFLEHFIHSQLLKDRALIEKQIIAFVSYVKHYTQHQLSFIFQLQKLNLQQLMRGYFLLFMPKCPELQKLKVTYEVFVDYQDYNQHVGYSDQKREEKRKSILQSSQETTTLVSKHKKSNAWSLQKERKEKKKERKLKKEHKRHLQAVQHLEKLKEQEEEWKELQQEERAYKKMKKSKGNNATDLTEEENLDNIQ